MKDQCMLTDGWRKLFWIEIPIVAATAAYWLMDGRGFVRDNWGVEADAAHLSLLATMGGMLVAQTGLFYAMLLWNANSSPIFYKLFCYWQIAIGVGDVFLVLEAAIQLHAGVRESTMAGLQIFMATLWGSLRLLFLLNSK